MKALSPLPQAEHPEGLTMADRPQIKTTIPILASLNLDETSIFYARLGFIQTGRWEGEYLTVARDEVELHFWLCNDRKIAENTACYIWVEDAAALHAEFAAKGIGQMVDPVATDYNELEFSVIDPHGNLLRIGSDTTTAPAT